MIAAPRAAFAAGRVILASLFVLAGVNKIVSFPAVQAQMESAGLVPAALLLPAVIALELCGGALVAWGRFLAVLAALGLAVFTLATNYYFHDFWNLTGEMAQLELSLFFKNVAIAGGLVAVAGALAQQRRPT
jgi:putative oxidoreductase